MTTRIYPPLTGSTSITTHGRTTTTAATTPVDVPDHDAMVATANGWLAMPPGGTVGITANRPTAVRRGLQYLDTTLGKIIFHDGATWRDPATGSAV